MFRWVALERASPWKSRSPLCSGPSGSSDPSLGRKLLIDAQAPISVPSTLKLMALCPVKTRSGRILHLQRPERSPEAYSHLIPPSADAIRRKALAANRNWLESARLALGGHQEYAYDVEIFAFRLYQSGKEVKDLAMSIEASGLPEAKVRFQALWLACLENADAAVLVNANGQIVWGAESSEDTGGREPG